MSATQLEPDKTVDKLDLGLRCGQTSYEPSYATPKEHEAEAKETSRQVEAKSSEGTSVDLPASEIEEPTLCNIDLQRIDEILRGTAPSKALHLQVVPVVGLSIPTVLALLLLLLPYNSAWTVVIAAACLASSVLAAAFLIPYDRWTRRRNTWSGES